MANDESKRTGDLGKPQPQVLSAVPARKPASTAAASNRGNTAGGSRSGPTELPAQFGRYRVIKKLGGGGMGTVYLVENTELEREEALKVPHFGEGDDPQLRERFLREAKSAAKLDHANLCPVWDAGVLDGTYYMTMRFLKGKLLSDYTGTAQPVRKAVEIVTKLAQALESAHGKGVIHRDLKPSNVMMVAGVGPVIMDFGLAKQVRQEDQKLTQAGAALGTPAYMPPEQVKGELEGMGPASDVYSLGVILYELLTGRLPFEGTMGMIFGQILYTEPPLPSALLPGLNPTLDGICRKAMAKASAERYPSMNAFAAALLDFLRSTSATEAAGTLVPAAEDNAAVFQGATAGPGRQPAGHSDVFPAPGVAPQARASLPQTPRTQAPSGGATIGPRSDPQPQTVTMGQRAAERKTNVAVQKPGRKKPRRDWRLLVKVCKAVILAFCFAALVFGTLKLSVAVFRPKQPSDQNLASVNLVSPAPLQPQTSSPQRQAPGGKAASDAEEPKPEATEPGNQFGQEPAARKVYLSDLDETDWSGHEMFGKNGSSHVAAIAVNGIRFPKGLWTHPRDRGNCSVKYHLSGLEAAAFVTKVAINDTARPAIATPLTFQVRGDGEVLWSSAPMRQKGQIQKCEISVKDVRVLELRVDCPGWFDSAHAVWLDPYLLLRGPPDAALDAEKPKSQASSPRNAAVDAEKPKPQANSPPATQAESPDGVLPVGADGKPLNFDFETGTLKDWTAVGEAFVGQPIKGDTVFGRLAHANIKSQHQGQYWIGTYERAGDRPQGVLVSVPFKVTYPRASFLVGGGSGAATCVELVHKNTGVVFSRTSGFNTEAMRRITVDLRRVHGQEIVIRLVDGASGGWGHINFDDFRFQE